MDVEARRRRWEQVHQTKGEAELSWTQTVPAASLELFEFIGARPTDRVIDVRGGSSRLVDALIDRGFRDVAVLDLSEAALSAARDRLGERGARARWIAADVTRWAPDGLYDLWHDRAAFHFLTDFEDRAAYVERLGHALRTGGHAIIATFAPDGPERCSGLPIVRYSPETLSETLGPEYDLLTSRRDIHVTPWGTAQSFQFSLFRRA